MPDTTAMPTMEDEDPRLVGLRETWRDSGIDVGSLTIEQDGTVDGRIERAGDTQPDPSAPLPVLVGATGHDELVLGELIGEGGMGRVLSATQTSLAREVAVKMVRPGVGSALALDELLREARVVGSLEHPSIVPVHGLGVDAEGQPLMFMKRLRGSSWAARLDVTAGDPAELDAELEVLVQVANAIEYAHQHRVLHRDVKPDNVILGSLGEVVVVDWGLAVDLGGAKIGGLPRASRVRAIAGTLQYMAPEMAAGRGEALGVHTDVYLLGATLHHVLTGDPPHSVEDDNVQRLLFRVFTAPPPALPSWVPEELAAICRRATATDPANRFPSALAFRDAVISFRQHRTSNLVRDEADKRLAAALARAATESWDDEEAGRLLAQARFGFEQALTDWPDNERAAEGRSRALLSSVRRELDLRRPANAAALLEELDEVPDELSQQLDELRAAVDAERTHIETLETAALESDLGQAATYRRRFGLGFGVAMLAVCGGCQAWVSLGLGAIDHVTFVLATGATAAAFATPAGLMFRRVYPNAANRRLAITLGMMLLAQTAVFLAMFAAGVDVETSLAISLVQLAGSVGIKTFLLDRRVFWTTGVILLAAVVAGAWPSVAFAAVGVAYATYFIAGALLSWETSGDAPPRFLEDLHGS